MPITLAVDLRGGDRGPLPLLEAAVRFLSDFEDVSILAFGLEGDFPRSGLHPRLIPVICGSYITTEEKPTLAVKSKQDSTLVMAVNAVKEGKAYGVVSAGSTGAVLTAAYLLLGRVKGVKRPLLASRLPTLSEPVIFGDLGANADARPEFLLSFAIILREFAKIVTGKPEPKVCLLNIGEEEEKGSRLVKDTHNLLKGHEWYAGFIEPHQVWQGGVCDAVVSDGFSGNIFLKTAEGVVDTLLGLIKSSIDEAGISAKLGALLMKPVFRAVKVKMDYRSYGGAPFLGVKGLVVKAHGRSDAMAFYSALRLAYDLAINDIVGRIEKAVGGIDGGQEGT